MDVVEQALAGLGFACRRMRFGEIENLYARYGTAQPTLCFAGHTDVVPVGDAAGLTQFGVNLLRMGPGTWSSQRHWHTEEDEFLWVLEGEVMLVTEKGEELLRAGDCAGFKAGVADGHHLQNRSNRPALILEMGSRFPEQDIADYPDVDLRWQPTGYTHKDGKPYGKRPR
jgi:uncharacterized cupin superfamily protein